MFLKKIELQGFKSFADKTEIKFEKGITTVIGPNGSGKSNIVDAFRWVLGEQSMKSLRGMKSEDIIFAGTQSRKPVGFAEVNLVVDNSDGTLPIEYDEVVVTRRVYRSGESEYLINKTQCRLKDIQQLFFNTGVGKDGYSIIGQGKVEEILSSKSEDRRYIFEEAAGILKYRYRKNEAERKLENTRVNLTRVNDIISEIDGRLESLCIQAEKAKKYLNYREELKNKEIGLFNYSMKKNNDTLNELEEKMNISNEQLKSEEETLEKMQEDKVQTKEKIENILTKNEDIQKFMYESDNEIEKINSQINMLKMQKDNNDANFEILDKEIIELKELIEKNELDKKNRANKIETLIKNRKKFEDELQQKEEEYNEIYSKLSQRGEEVEKKKDIISNINEQKMNLRININELKNKNINHENIFAKIDKEEKEKIYLKDAKNMEKGDLQIQLNKLANEKKKIEDIIKEKQEKQDKINAEIEKYDLNIQEYTQQLRNKKSRFVFLNDIQNEREGYVKAVKEILLNGQRDAEFGKGIEGSVADIIKTPKEYEVAIEMSLGGYLQNIVTLSEQSATKCINYLKQNNLGRASFLPISAVKGKKIDNISKIQKEKGYIGVASDLVEFNKKYEQIVLNLLGRTIIVDSIENGINIAKKHGYMYKLVTLEGDIISATGQMTGGSYNKKTTSLLGRSKEIEELEKEIKQIENKLNKEIQSKEEYIENIENEDGIDSNLNDNLNNLNIDFALATQNLNNIINEIENLSKRIENIRNEKQNITKEKEDNLILIENQEKELVDFDAQIVNIQEEIQDYTNNFKEEQKYIDDLKDEITDLKISISSFDESNMSFEEMIELINNEIEKANMNILKKKQQKEMIMEENKKFEEEVIICEKQIEQIKSKKENIDKEIEIVKKEREDANILLNNLDKDIENSINNIALLKSDYTKLENKKNKIEDEIESLKTRIVEEYEVSIENIISNNIQLDVEPTKVQKEINDLRRNIKNLGSVNIEAIEEYKESKERFDFLSEQKDDLENTENKLKKLIQEMTVIMKEQFRTRFKIINENFSQVFEKLFGGGKAELRLTDENDILNCGVEIEAQPPGKKLQNMMLLSGGEKSLTAIALLFGILKANPSPFCILDEIEAALDDINIFRFAQFLKEYAQKTQFLIITHRKGTMEIAETLYGVTMQEQGVSKLISTKI